MKSIEISARTVAEAVELALSQLGKDRDEVAIAVLVAGEAGEEALVRVTVVDDDDDDPAADAKYGIVSRDGGHFEALFASGAAAFADAAGQLLRANLPGLSFRVSIDGESRTKCQVHLSTELPVLAPCEWTGRGLASAIVEQGDERPAVSLDVARRHEAARRAEDGTAVDVALITNQRFRFRNNSTCD